MRTHRVLGVGLVILALLLVANPLYVYPNPDEINEVQYSENKSDLYFGDGGNFTPSARYDYEELSDRGKEVVDRAREAEDNSITFYGDDERPEEFEFVNESQSVRVAGSVYEITRDDETAYIRTYEHPPTTNETQRSRGLIALGIALGAVGLVYVWREQSRNLGLTLGGIGGLELVANVANRYGGSTFDVFAVLGSSAFIVLALLATIVSLGYLLYKTMREREGRQLE